MEHMLTYNAPITTSYQSKVCLEAFRKGVSAFNENKYLESFYLLLDYISPDIRVKYGDTSQRVFTIPHGSIVINISLESDILQINVPFLSMPAHGRIPLLRRLAGMNIGGLNLTRVTLRDEKLYFEFECPIDMAHPSKIYYILQEICFNGDRHDDEFISKFGASRISEPLVTAIEPDIVEQIYQTIQLSCKECLDAVNGFERERKFGYAWNVLAATLLKIHYYAQPQGQLLNELDSAVETNDRDDLPLPDLVKMTKAEIEKLYQCPKEELAKSLYRVETFISDKNRSNLNSIQTSLEELFKKAVTAYQSESYMECCLLITYKFYELYYYNSVPEVVDAVLTGAMSSSSAQEWKPAAAALIEAFIALMDGELGGDAAGPGDEPIEDESVSFDKIK